MDLPQNAPINLVLEERRVTTECIIVRIITKKNHTNLPVEIQFTQSKLYQADKQSLSTFKSLHKQEVDLFL